ncbi:MAG TPA: chemotaxis protein CheB [Marinilabiliaceae bacterium]|nr:chemotaxis protein CheB [Marinilabiliaceae bacterium]
MHDADFKIVVIGGSAGSFSVVSNILAAINPDFKIPIVLSLHRLKHVRSGLVEGLSLKSLIKVVEPNDKDKLMPNTVYLAPANYHLFIELDGTVALSTEEAFNHSRPSIDYTLSSAAYVYREKTLGILLTGANKDGAQGIKDIADKNGYTIVQDPLTADIDTMPKAALRLFTPNEVISPKQIVQFLNSLPI